MTFFEALAGVIDRNLRNFCRDEQVTVDEAYDRILGEIRNNHAEWFSNRIPNLNYQQPECRLAYLYVVAAANANTFKFVIETDQGLRDFILELANRTRTINICALGGGPGTELLALAKFFYQTQLGFPVSINFQLLDRAQEWANSWYAIRDEISRTFHRECGSGYENWPMIPSGNFLQCDVTDFSRASSMSDIWKQDIYVLNFLLSEIFQDDPGLRQFMANICQRAPVDSRFVFIERRGGMWEDRIIRIANEAGLQLFPFAESRRTLDADEIPAMLGDIYTRFSPNQTPRPRWNVVYSIGVKL